MGFTEHYLSGMMQSSAEVLGRHGYEHVKAEDLARSVGMSVGSLYRRYGSKQHFAWTVRSFHEDTFCKEVDWAFFCKHGADGVSFREAFFTFWEALTHWALGLSLLVPSRKSRRCQWTIPAGIVGAVLRVASHGRNPGRRRSAPPSTSRAARPFLEHPARTLGAANAHANSLAHVHLLLARVVLGERRVRPVGARHSAPERPRPHHCLSNSACVSGPRDVLPGHQ